MKTIAKIIKKVAIQARRAVLFGALVGGVSMASYATEGTAGPTIERAQLETVNINLEAVVTAITKVDPNWVKGLPKLTGTKINALTSLYWYEVDQFGNTVGTYKEHGAKDDIVQNGDCKDESDEICLFGSTESNLPNGTSIGSPSPDRLIMTTEPQ